MALCICAEGFFVSSLVAKKCEGGWGHSTLKNHSHMHNQRFQVGLFEKRPFFAPNLSSYVHNFIDKNDLKLFLENALLTRKCNSHKLCKLFFWSCILYIETDTRVALFRGPRLERGYGDVRA